jgi:hypothetical protein
MIANGIQGPPSIGGLDDAIICRESCASHRPSVEGAFTGPAGAHADRRFKGRHRRVPVRTDDDDAAHRFTVQGEGDDSVGDQLGLNQTAAVLLLLIGQLLELVPGPIEADPMRDHAVDPDPVTVGPVGHARGEADQSGFGGTVLR